MGFCGECGKPTEGNEVVCSECRRVKYVDYYAKAQDLKSWVRIGSPITGLANAIVSNCFGLTALLVQIFVLVNLDEYALVLGAIPYLIFFIIGLPLGIKAVVIYVRECRNWAVRPVATLVVGLVGIAINVAVVLILLLSYREAVTWHWVSF